MSIPTEPGWYWWRWVDEDIVPGGWECLQVSDDAAGTLYAHVLDPSYPGFRCTEVENIRGEWGERIPDSETLKAMREMAEFRRGASVWKRAQEKQDQLRQTQGSPPSQCAAKCAPSAGTSKLCLGAGMTRGQCGCWNRRPAKV